MSDTKDSSILDSFINTFPTAPQGHGRYTITGSKANGKVEGKAQTIAEPATPEDYSRHLAGKQGLGIIPIDPDGMSAFGVIDDDMGDKPPEWWAKYCAANRPEFHVARSKSGKTHFYVFPEEPVPAEKMRAFCLAAVKEFELPVTTERFPKQTEIDDGDVGNWINLPSFGDERPFLDDKGEPMALEKFLALVRRVPCAAFDVKVNLTTASARVRHGETVDGNRHNDLKTYAVGLLKSGVDVEDMVVLVKARWYETHGSEDQTERDQLIKWLKKRGKQGGFDCDEFHNLRRIYYKHRDPLKRDRSEFILDFREHTIRVSAKTLSSPTEMANAVLADVGIYPDLKPGPWKARLHTMTANGVPEVEDDVGEQDSLKGLLRAFVSIDNREHYGKPPEDRSRASDGFAWYDEKKDRTWFHPDKAASVINKWTPRRERVGREDLLPIVRLLGGDSEKLHIRGDIKERWYWLPGDQGGGDIIGIRDRQEPMQLVQEKTPEEIDEAATRTVDGVKVSF